MVAVQIANTDVHAPTVNMFRYDILRRGLQIVGINIGLDPNVHGFTDKNIICWFNSDRFGRNNGVGGVETIAKNCTEHAKGH
mgnify:CR=1 FL=1